MASHPHGQLSCVSPAPLEPLVQAQGVDHTFAFIGNTYCYRWSTHVVCVAGVKAQTWLGLSVQLN
jgi:hypothetical protein